MVAFDVESNVGAGTGNRSWTHTPVGTPRAVRVDTSQFASGTDQVTAVSYGGVACARAEAALKTTGEPAGAYAYFLGAGIPTGPQTVLVSVNGDAASKRCTAITYTGTGDCEVVDSGQITSDAQASPVQIPLTIDRECAVSGVLFSGVDAASGIAPGAAYTQVLEYDASTMCASFIRRTVNAPAGTTNAEWTTTTTEDAVGVAVAIAEIAGAEVDLTPATMTLAAQALDPDPGMVAVGLTAAAMTLAGQVLDPDPGAVAVALTAAALLLQAQALDPAPGAVAVALTAAVMLLTAQVLDADPGSVAVALTPATMTLTAQPLSAGPGPTTVNLTPAVLTLTAQPLSAGPTPGPAGPLDMTYQEHRVDVTYIEPAVDVTYVEG